MSRLFQYKRSLFAVLVVLILAGNSVLLYSSIVRLTEAARDLGRANGGKLALSNVLVELLNAETGQRGFLITADQRYLAPYHQAQAALDDQFRRLQDAVKDNADQTDRLDQVKALTKAKFDELEGEIVDVGTRGALSAQRALTIGHGKELMDAIRAQLGTMRATADAEFSDRQSRYGVAKAYAFLALGVFVAGVLALLSTIVWLARREIVGRQAHAARITHYAETLDKSLRELERERNEITQLNEASNVLQSCNSLQEIADVIAPIMASMFEGHRGALQVYAASRNQLDCLAAWGGFQSDGPLAPTECWALRRGQEHSHKAGSGHPACGHLHVDLCEADRNTFCVPLVAHGDTLGLLTMVAKTQDVSPAQSLSAQRLAGTLARQVGLTLANMRLRETLNDQSLRDPLTNAFNRRYLQVVAQKETAQARRFNRQFAVVMLDVDHFKRFNDVHGHVAGDAALVLVATSIQRSIREIDWLFRYGGEEFLLILQEVDADEAAFKLDGLLRTIAELPLQLNGAMLPSVTVSIGAAIYPADGLEFDDLVKRADHALYNSKKAGRNRVSFAPSEAIAMEGAA